jgi:hypothetical protein
MFEAFQRPVFIRPAIDLVVEIRLAIQANPHGSIPPFPAAQKIPTGQLPATEQIWAGDLVWKDQIRKLREPNAPG